MTSAAAFGAPLEFPAAARNGPLIVEKLKDLVPADSDTKMLEVACGSGQHAVLFTDTFPKLQVFPSDLEARKLNSVRAWKQLKGISDDKIAEPQLLDCSKDSWPMFENDDTPKFDLVMTTNLCHISPWEATAGLVRGSGRVLCPGGKLVIYGPFKVNGEFTTESNKDFDTSLRSQDASWGIRDIGDLESVGKECGITLQTKHEMPSNNFLLVFQKE